jgi:cellobiose phosphorylase
MDAVRGGYINQFSKSLPRCNALWFLMVGFNLIILGRAVDWYLFPGEQEQAPHAALTDGKEKSQEERQQQMEHKKRSLVRSERVVPRELGYWCLGVGVAGAVALPIGGFYLMIFQGAAILLAK